MNIAYFFSYLVIGLAYEVAWSIGKAPGPFEGQRGSGWNYLCSLVVSFCL